MFTFEKVLLSVSNTIEKITFGFSINPSSNKLLKDIVSKLMKEKVMDQQVTSLSSGVSSDLVDDHINEHKTLITFKSLESLTEKDLHIRSRSKRTFID